MILKQVSVILLIFQVTRWQPWLNLIQPTLPCSCRSVCASKRSGLFLIVCLVEFLISASAPDVRYQHLHSAENSFVHPSGQLLFLFCHVSASGRDLVISPGKLRGIACTRLYIPVLFNRCARCTLGCIKICVACTTKKGFTKVHHKLVTLNRIFTKTFC